MKTYSARFKNLVKQLENDIDFSDVDRSDLDVVEILEPSCNLNFVNLLLKITKEGKLVTTQNHFDAQNDTMENNFKDVMSKFDKQKICEIIENKLGL